MAATIGNKRMKSKCLHAEAPREQKSLTLLLFSYFAWNETIWGTSLNWTLQSIMKHENVLWWMLRVVNLKWCLTEWKSDQADWSHRHTTLLHSQAIHCIIIVAQFAEYINHHNLMPRHSSSVTLSDRNHPGLFFNVQAKQKYDESRPQSWC